MSHNSVVLAKKGQSRGKALRSPPESLQIDVLLESDFRSWNYVIYALMVVILFLPLVCDNRKRKAFTYYGKFFFYGLSLMIITSTLNCLFIFRIMDVRNAWIGSDVLKPLSWPLGIKWKLRDLENIVKGRAMVIVNHQSSLDMLALFEIWRPLGKCAVVAKKELLYLGPFGLCAWLSGLIFIDRRKPSKALKTLQEASSLIQQETKLLIFPEGTRNSKANKTGTLLPFKKGAFITAISNSIPIVPVVISPYYFLNSEEKYFGRGEMIIKVLPPIPTTNLTEKDVDDLMRRAHDIMSTTYAELFEEVGSTLPEDDYAGKTKNL